MIQTQNLAFYKVATGYVKKKLLTTLCLKLLETVNLVVEVLNCLFNLIFVLFLLFITVLAY